MLVTAAEQVFPKLTEAEIELLRPFATVEQFNDGDIVFAAGDLRPGLYIVETGALDILNPVDDNKLVVTHGPGEFSGDIDLLIRRPVVVSGIARGATRMLNVSADKLQEVLVKVSQVSDKLVTAFHMRREFLQRSERVGCLVLGYAHCKDTNVLREFLFKNFVPFTWYDVQTPAGDKMFAQHGSPKTLPAVVCPKGHLLEAPTVHELAEAAGLWEDCPSQTVDLLVIGAGPAGLATAVYAASEGIQTLVIDRIGPGGQAGGSSKIENFIGFPSGLSGADLAMRGVLQMHKFGARMVAPASVVGIERNEADRSLSVRLDCGAAIQSRVVLVATGVNWRKLAAKNADRYERAGIYYACTSIEATVHDKENVAVVGAGNSAGQAAVYLAECCPSRTVHVLARGKCGPSMSEYLYARMKAMKNIVIHENTQIEEVIGDGRIRAIRTAQETLSVSAIFVFIGAEPGCEFLPPEVKRDSKGYVLTGVEVTTSGSWPLEHREPCPLETSVPGILAAGDIRSGTTKRVGFAVGDGSQAVTCVHRLLAES
jgi:thioredoxin reductase (NADPH)